MGDLALSQGNMVHVLINYLAIWVMCTKGIRGLSVDWYPWSKPLIDFKSTSARLTLHQHLGWQSINILVNSQSLSQQSSNFWLMHMSWSRPSANYRPTCWAHVDRVPIKMSIEGIDWEYMYGSTLHCGYLKYTQSNSSAWGTLLIHEQLQHNPYWVLNLLFWLVLTAFVKTDLPSTYM